jgi:hypothetical protein
LRASFSLFRRFMASCSSFTSPISQFLMDFLKPLHVALVTIVFHCATRVVT